LIDKEFNEEFAFKEKEGDIPYTRQKGEFDPQNYIKTACLKLDLEPKRLLTKYKKSIKMSKPVWNLSALEFYKTAGIRSKYHKEWLKEIQGTPKSLQLE